MSLVDDILNPVGNVVQPVAALDPTGIIPAALGVVGLGGTEQRAAALRPGLLASNSIRGDGGLLDIPGNILGSVTGILGGGGGPVDLTGWSGGNGRFATRTTVETMDTTTGAIVKIKRMPGSPKLMNSEVMAAKKVFRTVRKLDSRLPKKTVRQSKAKQLTDAAVDAAIRIAHNPGDQCK